jgi:dynactin 1
VSTSSRTESPFKTPGLPASKLLSASSGTPAINRRQSSPVPSPQTTPRPSATVRASLSPATPSFPRPDPLKLRRSIAGTSPTRQPLFQSPEKSPEKTPDRSPERSPEKSQLGLSPAKSTISESPEKRSPPSFRHRLLSESPEKSRRDAQSSNHLDSRSASSLREIEELTAKLRILETKRIEDRRRIREYEASKEAEGNFEKHKEKLHLKMSSLQEEHRQMKIILKETQKQLSEVQNSAAEHSELLEMATLDREMAEERCEVLQLELDSLKERQEELVAENEYLKSENEEFIRGAGVGEGGERTAGSLQLERQNERLKEALVRLRDITGTRESELKSEIAALTEEIEQLTAIKGMVVSKLSNSRAL